MRIGVPLVIAFLAIGCNAIIDWSELHKTPTGTKNGKGGDDDDDTSSSSSSGKPSSGGGDGGASGTAACDPSKPFGAPVAVLGKVNSASHETAPSLTADERTMFFQRTVGVDGGSILMATRAKIDDPWGDPIEMPELAQNQADYSPTVTGDGLTLFWAELTTATPRHEVIKIATRDTPASKFGNVRVLEVSNTTADDTAPSISQDGTELFFTSTRQNGEPHLFHSLRGIEGFAAPTILTELVAGTARDTQSALSADGLTIFFGSERSGGLGQSDVWTAKRPSKTAAFANISHVDGPVNTANIEWPTWLSSDGCRLYLGVLEGGAGDIVVATRPK